MIVPTRMYKLWIKNSSLYSKISEISQISSTADGIHLSG